MIEKKLEKIVKTVDGNILCIGIKYNQIMKLLLKNRKIISCKLIETNIDSISNNKSKDKVISLKDIKKIFGKKKIDYIICDFKEVKKELKHYIKNNIYINKTKTYIYGNIHDINLNELKYRYERYGSKVNEELDNSEFLLEIDNNNVKIDRLKSTVFYTRDCMVDAFEEIEKYIIK